jgi:hypothetical protein
VKGAHAPVKGAHGMYVCHIKFTSLRTTTRLDKRCNDGWASTPIGCCPLGTENVHNFCESPEEHDQATNSYLACLAAAAAQDHDNPAQYAIDAANCASGGG